MNNSELKFWLALNNIDGLGPSHHRRLMKYHRGSAERAWHSARDDLEQLDFGEKLIQNFLETRKNLVLKAQMDRISKLGVVLLPISSHHYPPLLKEIHDPPPLLYVLGEIKKADELALAVVGSRKMTSYGREVTQNITESLVAQGLTIVSGLALGVDACAHQAALSAGGRTIAVLGSGIDLIQPTTNVGVARRIIEGGQGAVISEFPLGTQAAQFTFPRRNRIISGLSLGVLVTEAAAKSGALITVGQALEQGRDVFAVPGSIFNLMSVGPHNLIQQGAKLVNSVTDITEELELEARSLKREAREVVPETPEEEKILKFLGNDERHVDKIIQASDLPAATITATLTMMEMKGKVKNLGNQRYRVSRQ